MNPGLMQNRPDVPNPLTDHERVLELHGRGHRPARRENQEKDDPLFHLFHELKQGIKNGKVIVELNSNFAKDLMSLYAKTSKYYRCCILTSCI